MDDAEGDTVSRGENRRDRRVIGEDRVLQNLVSKFFGKANPLLLISLFLAKSECFQQSDELEGVIRVPHTMPYISSLSAYHEVPFRHPKLGNLHLPVVSRHTTKIGEVTDPHLSGTRHCCARQV